MNELNNSIIQIKRNHQFIPFSFDNPELSIDISSPFMSFCNITFPFAETSVPQLYNP